MARVRGPLVILALLCAVELVLLSVAGADASPRHRRTAKLTLAAPTKVIAGSAFRLSGRLKPHHRGRVVIIQRHTRHGWVRAARARTGPASRFHVRLTSNRIGITAYRAHVRHTRSVRAATSPVRRLRVVAPPTKVVPGEVSTSAPPSVSAEQTAPITTVSPLAASSPLRSSDPRTATRAKPGPGTSPTPEPSAPAPCAGQAPTKPDGSTWQCTFDDEFDATTGDPRGLDTSKWVPEVSTSNNFYVGDPATGVVCYLDKPSTISVSDGALHLSVVKTRKPTDCGPYTTAFQGGMVHTYGTFAQTYGRFQVRARLPENRLPGVQETLWLYPVTAKYGPWPKSGEIDFAEFYSQYPTLDVPYLHYSYDPSTTNTLTGTNVVTNYTCVIDPEDWNTYTLVWQPGVMEIRYNGQTCLVDHYQANNSTDPAAPFNQPFYLLLTQAVGFGTNAPTAATAFPATLDVDYVRAWQ